MSVGLRAALRVDQALRWAFARRDQRGASRPFLVGSVGLSILAGGVIANAILTGPSTPPPQALNCAAAPHLCGFPDLTNTGVGRGSPGTVTLTNVSTTTCSSPCGSAPAWKSDTSRRTMFLFSGTLGSATTGFLLPTGWTMSFVGPNVSVRNVSFAGTAGSGSTVTFCSQTAIDSSQGNCFPQGGWGTTNPLGLAKPSGGGGNNGTLSDCEVFGSNTLGSGAFSLVTMMTSVSSMHVDHCNLHGGAPIGIQANTGTSTITDNYMWGMNGIPGEHLQPIYHGGTIGASTSILVQHNTLFSDYPGGSNTSGNTDFYGDGGNVANAHALVDNNLMMVSGSSGFQHQFIVGDAINSGPTFLWVTSNHFIHAASVTPNQDGGQIYCDSSGCPKWPGQPFTGANNNMSCQNIWDDGPLAGSGADSQNTYPSSNAALTPCPAPPAWLPGAVTPPGTAATTTSAAGATTTTVAGGGGAPVLVSDPSCLPAQTDCPMSFVDNVALDKDPLSGAAFGDPTPGLLAGTTDAALTNVTAMSAACSPADTTQNCGYTNHYTTAHNGRSFFFRNCIVNGQIVIDSASTVKLYFTNCHIYLETTYNANASNSNQGWGWIGKGGVLHFVHDLFETRAAAVSGTFTGEQSGGSCAGGGSTPTCHPLNVIMEGGTTTNQNQVYYNKFLNQPDALTADSPSDIQWNYFTSTACVNPACQHTDNIQDYFGNNNSVAVPLVIANNYLMCQTCDSSQGLNLTDDFGANHDVVFNNNKIGVNAQGSPFSAILVAQQASGLVTNISINNNTAFGSATKTPKTLRIGSPCTATLPNACIISYVGNTAVAANGSSSALP